MKNRRTLLARGSGIATRQRVYRIDDGLEIDEVDHYEVHRWRVLWEDIVLVTIHRSRGALFLSICGILAAIFTASAVAIGRTEPVAGWVMFGLSGGPLLLLFIVRLLMGVDEVNVYGRRSRAKLRFAFRKSLARKAFDDIVSAARRKQAAFAAAAVSRELSVPTDLEDGPHAPGHIPLA